MPTLAELRERTGTQASGPSRSNNPEVLVSDMRSRMRSTEFIEQKLQAALQARRSTESLSPPRFH